MDYQNELNQITEQLYNIPIFGKPVGLKNIQRIFDGLYESYALQEYLEKVKIIHVAGTNGKGSVCRFLQGIYEEAGYNTSMFTSPHMHDIRERIQIGGQLVEQELFIEAFYAIEILVKKMSSENLFPTFFEWLFGMYMYCSMKSQCQLLIVEVGIGGILDTTNVLPRKDLSIITSIGLDHQHLLGDTIEAIAAQKSGIIMKDVPVIYDGSQASVAHVIQENCTQKGGYSINGSPFEVTIHNILEKRIAFSIVNKYYKYEEMCLKIVGSYQFVNLNLVLTAVHQLQNIMTVSDEHILNGVKQVYHQGRFEVIDEQVILDGAHNELGIKALIDSLKFYYPFKRFNVMIGVKEGKNYEAMLRDLVESNLFDMFYVCQDMTFKSVDYEHIEKVLSHLGVKFKRVNNTGQFINEQRNQDRQLVVTGSLYMISQIREEIIRGGHSSD
jgi:dihydrofolate synthase/folylpolyglutamate synthase